VSLDVSAEREIAQNLVANSRLYRQTAASTGEAGVASVLDDLERVLVEVANGPATLSSKEVGELRQRIESKGILFKVRVLGSQVREREKGPARERAGQKT
jgi:sensor domain CHASE-containing protein